MTADAGAGSGPLGTLRGRHRRPRLTPALPAIATPPSTTTNCGSEGTGLAQPAFLPADHGAARDAAPFSLCICSTGIPPPSGRPEVRPFLTLLRESEDVALVLENDLRGAHPAFRDNHGDTKLENFLFDAAERSVRSLVDLDTIAHTWLSDWGDGPLVLQPRR